ncbi:hypothetical protein [Oceanobacillus caeni]|uniref:hypothetical protein n=1 Tax=Oceanobacillus caeni TaxID=405946 RepID=UPI000A8E6B4D|nr:hypothetical protein [Oceanobacillus caeni]
MYRFIYVTIVGFCLLFLTACGGGNASTKDSDYDQTKKMVIDILQTDEGKKALTDTLSDEKLKKGICHQFRRGKKGNQRNTCFR